MRPLLAKLGIGGGQVRCPSGGWIQMRSWKMFAMVGNVDARAGVGKSPNASFTWIWKVHLTLGQKLSDFVNPVQQSLERVRGQNLSLHWF